MDTSRAQTLQILHDALPDLQRRFDVRSLRIFGSVARDESSPESDVDILVDFAKPVGLFRLADLRRYLSEILGRPVDVGTEESLRPRVRRVVIEEAIRVA